DRAPRAGARSPEVGDPLPGPRLPPDRRGRERGEAAPGVTEPPVRRRRMDRPAAACEYLLDLRRTRRPVAALPVDVVPRSLAEGYDVQDRLVRTLLARSGGHPIGYKVACTSVLAQKALGVDGPFFGVLLSHSSHQSPATLSGADFTVRCAEAEF